MIGRGTILSLKSLATQTILQFYESNCNLVMVVKDIIDKA